MTGDLSDGAQIGRALLYFAAMLLSLTFHEAAHALVATLKGDSTARDLGRLSLNPLRHADLFGTVLLPLAGALSHLPIIGWAKPVPVDLRRLRRPRWDHLQIAAAGPLANLVLAALALAAGVALARRIGTPAPGSAMFWLEGLLTALMWVNAYLAIFNLLPIPPLDGGTVASAVLPAAMARGYERVVGPYGFMILLVLMAAHGLDWLPGMAAGYLHAVRAILP